MHQHQAPGCPLPATPGRQLALQRPLVTFDLETTGLDVNNDRIVSLAAIKLQPDGSRQSLELLLNPGRPIPLEAAAVHGISDDQVRCVAAARRAAQHGAVSGQRSAAQHHCATHGL